MSWAYGSYVNIAAMPEGKLAPQDTNDKLSLYNAVQSRSFLDSRCCIVVDCWMEISTKNVKSVNRQVHCGVH